jgi:hypothetical protein
MDNSSCDMLDHANVNFSSSPLHQMLTLLKLKASNKVAHVLICFASFQNDLVIVFPKCLYAYHVQDDFSLGDLSTRKLQRILRVSKSSCCFFYEYGYQLFTTCPLAVHLIVPSNELNLLLHLFYGNAENYSLFLH